MLFNPSVITRIQVTCLKHTNYRTMKNTLLALFVLLIIIALSSQPLLGSADESSPSNEQVVDITGKKLRANTYYNVLLTMPYTNCRSPEGLSLSSIHNNNSNNTIGNGDDQIQACPLDVVVVNRYQSTPLRFTPHNPKKGVIRVSSDLNIMFPPNASCPYHSTVWKLDQELLVITTDGFVGNHGSPQSIGNWFKIEKYAEAYKFVYCPSVVNCISCNKHDVQCKSVGLFVDHYGNRRLALSDVPFQVKFVKA